MHDLIISWFQCFPKELATFLIAMLPIAELRASIPVAITVYKMPPVWAWFWSVLGSVALGTLTVSVLEPAISYLTRHSDFLGKLWRRYIDRIHRKNRKSFDKWGSLALIIFIAIPLPMTGAFSGAVAASIFQIPFKKAALLISAGCAIAGIIVTGVTLLF